MRGKFSFRYVDIWFDVTKYKFIVKNSSFKMLVVFSPISVADTKITFVYNFVAPLMFISSLSDSFVLNPKQFVDDKSLFLVVQNITLSAKNLNDDLKKVSKWVVLILISTNKHRKFFFQEI